MTEQADDIEVLDSYPGLAAVWSEGCIGNGYQDLGLLASSARLVAGNE